MKRFALLLAALLSLAVGVATGNAAFHGEGRLAIGGHEQGSASLALLPPEPMPATLENAGESEASSSEPGDPDGLQATIDLSGLTHNGGQHSEPASLRNAGRNRANRARGPPLD